MNTAPDPKDVQDFQFKQSHISQILDAFTSVPIACSLLASDKKRGLLYVGQNTKILVLKPGEDSDPKWKIELDVPVVVSKLMLNCDCSYLAVAPHGPSVLIYDAQALSKSSLQLLHEIRISSSNIEVFVNDLRWNPSVPGMICTVASDYTVGSFEIKERMTIELKALKKLEGLDVLCAAWSPKGKQIVVGCKNGSIVQLKPDLKVARAIPGPNPYIGEVVSILWISNYQFCAAYLGSEQRINVLIVDAPKGEANAIFTCYEDITYGVSDTEAEGSIPRYYFDHVPEWGLIIAASSNSSEIAVLGSTDGGATWYQWQLVDSGRAELPLIRTTESYPVGLAIDRSSFQKLAWGADSFLPHPVPILHILATSGQLCSFHMVNLTPNCPDINIPPTEIVATPPQSQLNVGTYSSLMMNGLITSTPRPKQPENNPDRPKPAVTGNIFDKLNKGSGFFAQTPQIDKPKQQEQKPESVALETKAEPPKEVLQDSAKPSVKLTTIKETIPQEPVQQKPTVEDETRDIRAYIEEHNLFEKELRTKLETQSWESGTEDERKKLVETSHTVDQFLRELKETTNSLSSDIAYLKALLLQSFAWVEETKSKNAANNDITTRSCGDSNKISDLQKLYYYTQTQLTQASKILDLEWSNRKTQEMSRMKIPSIEFVYQNLILHHKIIQEEKGKLEKLKTKWKSITRSNSILGLNRSLSNLSITSSKSSASLSRNTGVIEARCKAIASKTLSFTLCKQIKLKEHLLASTPRIIKPVNPSPIQHRLEKTLSSLDSFSITETTADTKSKVVEPVVSKQTTVEESTEKSKQQSPLASLNSIVARIGTSEANSGWPQNKTQTKQAVFTLVFRAAAGAKAQTEKNPNSTAIIKEVTETVKPKQDTITFSQANTPVYNLPNVMKSFPKVDSISFGTVAQKPEETQKYVSKDASPKTGKEAVANDSFKVDTNLFATSSLKDALSPETSSGKTPGVTSNALKFGTATPKTESATTFGFATPSTVPATVKSSPQDTVATSQTSAAETFSFASKPSSNAPTFSLKTTPTTAASQAQESLNLTGLFPGLQASNQTPSVSSSNLNANYKPTFGTPTFQMTWGKETPSPANLTITPASTTPSKETVSTTPSVTIEKVVPTETKAPSFPTSPVQVPTTSATSLFGQANTSNISIFGGISGSTPATSSFPATASTFGIPATPTSSMPAFSFNTTPATNAMTSTVTTASSTVSPFYSSLSKPTFGEALNLSTASPTSVNNTTPNTLPFGTVTTTTSGSVFGKPALTMNTQFPNTPPVSSANNAFSKPIISPASMPFGSSTNTSIFGGTPTTTTASIFSGNNTGSIFGTNTQAQSTGSIFGGNTAPMNTFGTAQKSIFDNSAQKSGSIFGGTSNAGTTSFFGGAASNTSPGGSTSVFANSASPMGIEQPVLAAQPAFGQPAAFDAKPVFGSQPIFGSKPIFGGGFNTTAFGASTAPPAFGSPPIMGGSPAPMDNMPKVFGSVGGSNTFESLATQPDALSFSSLAQKSPEAQKPPVFTSGSSFSSWR